MRTVLHSVLDGKAVETALRDLISDLDYDLHKQLESDEETGEDAYPPLADAFRYFYAVALAGT